MFPLTECTVILVNGSLLSLSQLLVLTNLILLIFIFSFNALIFHNNSLHFLIKLSYFGFFVFNFNSNRSNLLGDFLGFISSLVVLLFHDVQFVVKTGNNVFLTVDLSFEITLECSEANIISLLTSFKILNLSFESNKISFV